MSSQPSIGSAPKMPAEDSLLAVLSSQDAGEHEKAVACEKLAWVATRKSVPALAALLADEHLSDYARSGLEIIPDPAAAEALRRALPNLEGRLLAGVVNSLGVRRDAAAVPELRKLALAPDSGVAPEAIASLGMIATPDAVETLGKILADGPKKLRPPAAHALLATADHLARDGKTDEAERLRTRARKVLGLKNKASHQGNTDGTRQSQDR